MEIEEPEKTENTHHNHITTGDINVMNNNGNGIGIIDNMNGNNYQNSDNQINGENKRMRTECINKD